MRVRWGGVRRRRRRWETARADRASAEHAEWRRGERRHRDASRRSQRCTRRNTVARCTCVVHARPRNRRDHSGTTHNTQRGRQHAQHSAREGQCRAGLTGALLSPPLCWTPDAPLCCRASLRLVDQLCSRGWVRTQPRSLCLCVVRCGSEDRFGTGGRSVLLVLGLLCLLTRLSRVSIPPCSSVCSLRCVPL